MILEQHLVSLPSWFSRRNWNPWERERDEDQICSLKTDCRERGKREERLEFPRNWFSLVSRFSCFMWFMDPGKREKEESRVWCCVLYLPLGSERETEGRMRWERRGRRHFHELFRFKYLLLHWNSQGKRGRGFYWREPVWNKWRNKKRKYSSQGKRRWTNEPKMSWRRWWWKTNEIWNARKRVKQSNKTSFIFVFSFASALNCDSTASFLPASFFFVMGLSLKTGRHESWRCVVSLFDDSRKRHKMFQRESLVPSLSLSLLSVCVSMFLWFYSVFTFYCVQ